MYWSQRQTQSLSLQASIWPWMEALQASTMLLLRVSRHALYPGWLEDTHFWASQPPLEAVEEGAAADEVWAAA